MKIDIVQNRSRPRSQTQKISPQLILTNGNLNQLSDSSWQITFPPYFTSSSLYFHTFPQGSFALERFSFFTKTTGREVPIALYTRNAQEISGFKEQIINVLTELEADYGEWPHPNLVVYGAGSGGMEYCGATRTSLWALDHELTHSYFARGILSSHGNSGWIDEAVASWRDQAYPRNDQLTFSYSKMAGHSLYRRSTDNEAYSKGAQFLGHLDYLFANQGGLKKFLADFFIKNLFNPIRTVDLEKALESYFKASLGTLFQKYIYGKLGKIIFSQEKIENPYHPILSEKELRELL